MKIRISLFIILVITISMTQDVRYAYATYLYDTAGFSYDLAVAGDYVYVADGYSGLKVLNIANRDSAYRETVLKYDGTDAKNVIVDGDYLYLANREGGTKVFSLQGPANPKLLYTHENMVMDNSYWALSSNLKKNGNILYVGEKRGGLVALDVQNPNTPVELGRVQVPNADYPKEVQGIDISGNYAFVANPWKGMAVIDITSPEAMAVVATYDKPDGSFPGVWDVGIKGETAYILAQNYGVQAVNISDPLNPYFVTEFLMDDGRKESGDSPPADLTFYENYMLIANGLDGISVFSVSNPEIIKFVQKIETLGFAGSLEIVGTDLFFADGDAGIGVFSLSDIRPTPIPASIVFLLSGLVGIFGVRRHV